MFLLDQWQMCLEALTKAMSSDTFMLDWTKMKL